MTTYIYVITNEVTGKRYVGKSVHPITRFSRHKTAARAGKRSSLCASMRKYGMNVFVLNVVNTAETSAEADGLEQLYIALYHANKKDFGYNLTEGGGGGTANPDVRAQISATKKANPCRYWLGKKFSEEHRRNFSLSMTRQDVPDNEIRDMYANGFSAAKIAHHFNVTRQTIYNRLEAMSVSRRPIPYNRFSER